MVSKDILPTISKYSKGLADTVAVKKQLGVDYSYELDILDKLSAGLKKTYEIKLDLETVLRKTGEISDISKLSMFYKEEVLSRMESLRDVVDGLEGLVDKNDWPFPSYGDLLYSVK